MSLKRFVVVVISIQRLCRFEHQSAQIQTEQLYISIQRLCRFELNEAQLNELLARFQYNDCVGSRNGTPNQPLIPNLFQYNDCVGSREKLTILAVLMLIFQYNDCVGSSRRYGFHSFCSVISIQRLCRFELARFDFNKSFV